MLMKDKLQLIKWLKSNASLAEVENTKRFGLVENERFTERARKAYIFLWGWSTPRFSGNIGLKHDKFYNSVGKEVYYRRINRVENIINKLIQS